MVNHNQQRIKVRGDGQVGDKVIGDLLERARHVRLDQGERGNCRVCVGLILLACGIAFDIPPHELGKAGPSEFKGNKLMSFEITRMSGGLMVMTVE